MATAATVGTVAIPQIRKYGYNEPLFLGSLAAGGTLGILIPPSINLVIYGVLTNSSVPKLYLAGIIPGFAMAALFMLTVVIACVAKPSWGQEDPRDLGPAHGQPGSSGAAAGHLPAGGGFDLRRPGHADRGPPRWACWARWCWPPGTGA